jgi:putative chitinase
MTRPVDIVRRACPKARPAYLLAFEQGDDLLRQHGIVSPLRLAHFLAQVCHESGGLTLESESGNYSAARLLQIFGAGKHSACVTPEEAERLARNGPAIFERVYGLGNPRKARELGNTAPGDGFRYRGKGLMQTTGRANYRRIGQKCGVDFESHPQLVLVAEHALKPALMEWSEGQLNDAADRDDIRAITRRINGGYNGLADRQAWFAKLKPLIDRVDLSGPQAQPGYETPAPPVPAPRPKAAARNAGIAAGVMAALAAASQFIQSHPVETVIGLIAAAAIVVLIVRTLR